MIKIELTQGQFALIDDEDFPIVAPYKWCAHKIGDTYYAATCAKDGRIFHMHSLLLHREHGQEIDHINRDGRDNRRCNIRLVSRAENNLNKPLQKNSSTGLKGVYWNDVNKCWYAKITVGNKQKYLGSYQTKEAALAARQIAEVEAYGRVLEY